MSMTPSEALDLYWATQDPSVTDHLVPEIERLLLEAFPFLDIAHEPGMFGHLQVTYHDGPAPAAILEVITVLLRTHPRSMSHSALQSWTWPGLYLIIDRQVSPVAYGWASLSASLAGTCPSCDPASSAPSLAFQEALQRPDPQEFTSHENLQALLQWSVPLPELTGLAEFLSSLGAPQKCPSQAATLFLAALHDAGHLTSLREMHTLLH